MRAVGLDQFGGPEVLKVLELPMPIAAPGAVVVEVVAATVNPTDTLLRRGAQAQSMIGLPPPYVPGMELSGYVHQVGQGSTSFAIGQRVMGIVEPRRLGGGAQAQFVSVPEASLVPVEDSIDMVDAATVPMNGLTAAMAIEALDLSCADTVLVTGSAGAVGGYVVQLARLAGLTVLADSSDQDAPLLRRLGADQIVPRGAPMHAAVRRIRPNGVDGVVDTARLGSAITGLIRHGGTIVGLRKPTDEGDPRLQNRYVFVMSQATNTAAIARLAELAASGALTPRVALRLPMTRAAEAHQLVEAGGLRGRVVLLMRDEV